MLINTSTTKLLIVFNRVYSHYPYPISFLLLLVSHDSGSTPAWSIFTWA